MVIVLDQLGSDTLLRHLPQLDPQGLIRQSIKRGVYYERSRYPYAGTFTAPGHATIHTGFPPAQSGIVANNLWSRELKHSRPIVHDTNSPVINTPQRFVSPKRLQKATVGDLLKSTRKGQAKVVSLSIKARAAVLSAGKKADLVLWYEGSSRRFTSSTFYTNQKGALPKWIDTWSKKHSIGQSPHPWEPLDPQLYASLLGKDDQPGEGNSALGLGTRFPHHADATSSATSWLTTPHSSTVLIDLAAHAVKHMRLGKGHEADLLALSISGTDYVGHIFGPHSWEYLDNLRRVDRALGQFVDRLRQTLNTAVLITSDHGALPLPERLRAQGVDAGRINTGQLTQELNQHLTSKLGQAGPWIETYSQPFIIFSKHAQQQPWRTKVRELTRAYLERKPAIHAVYDLRELKPCQDPCAEPKRSAAESVFSLDNGDLFVVPAKGFIPHGGTGTSHGSPWDYDQEVPAIADAPGLTPKRITSVVSQLQIAPTVAQLLDLSTKSFRAAPLPL